MIFLDSSFIISSSCTAEENHEKAKQLFESAIESRETLVFTDHVLSEVVTLIRGRYNSKKAFEVGKSLLIAGRIEMIQPSREDIEKAVAMVLKYQGFSFCDALTAVIMERNEIKKIVSFDSDFDSIKTIERIH